MKKTFIIIFAIILIILGGCLSSSTSSSPATKETSAPETKDDSKVLTKEEFEKMYTNPNDYKGAKVDFYAKIFTVPEKDNQGTYLQAFADPKNSEKNTVIAIKDPNLDVKVGDIIHVIGKVEKVFEGENALGGTIKAPVIIADKIEKSDYATAFAPAIKTIDVNKEINQHGYIIKLTKLELAKAETRIYVTVTNQSKNKINFFDFNTKLVMNNKQYELEDNFEANYPKVQSELLPGVRSEGILTFSALETQSGTLKVIFEGSSDNYELNFKPFEFEIKF
ncbi:DUF4352 domain-containing protein [Tepidibacillus fermentans]|uniref:DUF4352 domain-containing protein n=1 Tax=Tepidibacillus fermentans TaxID=1281767 RepID=A0A4R3KL91_9BACI|nr:DUF4352 domain-containing protein [Tepidibacillus fermentans]TCS84507.1 hypothetical protein EDD72_101171 [Tepidibacillus fermentans]